MKASRLVSVMLLLQVRGRMTAAELADELEVSVRTVYRDVEALSAAGVPVYSEAGPAGGFRLVDGYQTRLTGMSTAEAEALLVAGTPGPVGELGLGTVLAAAQAKLMAALPADMADRAFETRRRFHLDATGWFKASRVPPLLGELADAVWHDRRLRITYRASGSAAADRIVDPLGLVLKGGVWYLVASRDGLLRTYRASRVERAEPTGEAAARPPGFDLAAEWRRSVADYEAEVNRIVVTVRATPWALGVLTGEEPAAGAEGLHVEQVTFDDDDSARESLLALGPAVEVLEPAGFRARMADAARRTAALYDAPAPPAASA